MPRLTMDYKKEAAKLPLFALFLWGVEELQNQCVQLLFVRVELIIGLAQNILALRRYRPAHRIIAIALNDEKECPSNEKPGLPCKKRFEVYT